MITILLVDDQPAARAGLRLRLSLEPDMTVVGEAGDGLEAVALAARVQPQVIIMDAMMPVMGGLEAVRALQTAVSQMAVIITTMYDTAAARSLAETAGAAAFIPKQSDPQALLAAIRRAAGKNDTGLQKIGD